MQYGSPLAACVLIQPVGDHDLPGIADEVREIEKMTGQAFTLLAVKVDDWNRELTPWEASAVYGKEAFGDGAAATLEKIAELCKDQSKTYYIGGYSLAGLFSLWAAYQTDLFSGVAAASPSVWFPEFTAYMKVHEIKTGKVYLSLGEKEEKTKNPVMSQVGVCIRDCYVYLQESGCRCTLEWNQGGHFKEPGVRTAKAFAWVMEHEEGVKQCTD